jgi:catechol 2,3-dioxygenase
MATMDSGYRMAAALTLGTVELTVASLDRGVEYYVHDVGMRMLTRDTDGVWLGVPGRALVILRERPGARPASPSNAGLSHFAPQVPTAADLARFVMHYASRHAEFQLTDHVVAHSCYVYDPDGHCIEITCARPRDEWRWQNGKPVVVADRLDLTDFSEEPGVDLPFEGLPAATTMGHVQLKVTDAGLTTTEPFYRDLLGFDVAGRLGTMFLAVGVVDEHALLVVTNRFATGGSDLTPEESAHLVGVDLHLPGPGDIHMLAGRLSGAGYPHDLSHDVLRVGDPSGNLLRFSILD